MKPQSPIIYKHFLQKRATTSRYQYRTIAEKKDEICIADLTLAPMETWSLNAQYKALIVIPLAGAITFKNIKDSYPLSIGTLLVIYPESESQITITNPYSTENVNCFFIQFNTVRSDHQLHTIELPFFEWQFEEVHLSIRQFRNREEFEFIPQLPHQSLWVFCLAGAFEIENRLLEDRDGLLLPHSNSYEMESLIEGSLLLFFQYPDPIHR